ncbi:hypothetical protein BJ322DRAFT_1020427 [Thelephora terrestris]|uniref:Uncharacterized protein n=1 Tax=Thelephora terrestris TaxID=56493 RepID=A0A9P6L792_9AGAM|nr:hypothetical protein BJ322DRAFT_1020427 [Thelephora terrestris]
MYPVVPKKYLVGNDWANGFKTHNELTMYPLDLLSLIARDLLSLIAIARLASTLVLIATTLPTPVLIFLLNQAVPPPEPVNATIRRLEQELNRINNKCARAEGRLEEVTKAYDKVVNQLEHNAVATDKNIRKIADQVTEIKDDIRKIAIKIASNPAAQNSEVDSDGIPFAPLQTNFKHLKHWEQGTYQAARANLGTAELDPGTPLISSYMEDQFGNNISEGVKAALRGDLFAYWTGSKRGHEEPEGASETFSKRRRGPYKGKDKEAFPLTEFHHTSRKSKKFPAKLAKSTDLDHSEDIRVTSTAPVPPQTPTMSTAKGKEVILSSPPPPIFGPPQVVVAPGSSHIELWSPQALLRPRSYQHPIDLEDTRGIWKQGHVIFPPSAYFWPACCGRPGVVTVFRTLSGIATFSRLSTTAARDLRPAPPRPATCDLRFLAFSIPRTLFPSHSLPITSRSVPIVSRLFSTFYIFSSHLPISILCVPITSRSIALLATPDLPLRLAPLNRGPDLLTAIFALSDSEGFVASSPEQSNSQSLPMAPGNGIPFSNPPPPAANRSSPATPEASNKAETTQKKGVVHTQTGDTLPKYYTSPIVVPPEITPITSATTSTASSESPEPIKPTKKAKTSWKAVLLDEWVKTKKGSATEFEAKWNGMTAQQRRSWTDAKRRGGGTKKKTK